MKTPFQFCFFYFVEICVTLCLATINKVDLFWKLTLWKSNTQHNMVVTFIYTQKLAMAFHCFVLVIVKFGKGDIW